MPKRSETPAFSSGQAVYVLERLVSERRVTTREVTQYLADIGREIRDIESRMAVLRAAAGSGARQTAAPQSRRRKRRAARTRHAAPSTLQLNGRYMGYYRQIPKRDQPKYSAMRKEKGVEAAIKAIREHLGK
jgi:hypothetical protein